MSEKRQDHKSKNNQGGDTPENRKWGQLELFERKDDGLDGLQDDTDGNPSATSKSVPSDSPVQIRDTDKKDGYKLTKLGWIPEGWEVKKLIDVATIQTGIQKGARKEGKKVRMPYLRVANVQDGHLDLSEIKYIEVLANEIQRYLLRKGDVLMTEGGDFDKLGRGTIWKNEIESCLHQNHIFAVRTNKEILTPYFLNAFSSSEKGKKYFISCSKQSTNLASINSTQLKNLTVSIPPLPEQRAIAACLSTWDTAIHILTQLIAQKELCKKGLMQQLLTGKKRLPEFSEEWKTWSFKELLKEVKRPVEWNDNELYDLISVKRRSGGLFHRESLYGHQILTKDLRTAKVGDFLISKMQIVHGASGLTIREFDGMKISGSYLAVRARNEDILNVEFLNWYSQLPYFYHQCYISSYGVHIEKMTFDFKLFLKEEIKLPPIEEQNAIAQVLQCADEEIELLNQKLNHFKDQKKGLMQQLLTGKKRLSMK